MSQKSRDEFDRLQDQDPAAGVELDAQALLANVRSRLPVGSSDEAAESGTESEAVLAYGGSLAVVPPRRRSLAWAQIAASAAAAALLSGGVVYAATEHTATQSADSSLAATDEQAARAHQPELTDQGQTSADTAGPPAADLSGRQEIGPALGVPSADTAQGRQPEPMQDMSGSRDASSAQASSKLMAFNGREVYSAKGLSDTPSIAHAYGYDESSAVTSKTFDKLRKAFNVKAKAEKQWGSLVASDGVTSSLSLTGYGTGAFWYSSYAEQKASKAPKKPVAIASAKEIMEGLGIDPALYNFTFDTYSYDQWIEAEPASGANESGKSVTSTVGSVTASLSSLNIPDEMGWDSSSWRFEFNKGELTSVSGSLAKQVDLGEYPVVSATQAVDRLNDKRFGGSTMAWPAMAREGDARVVGNTEPGEADGPTAMPQLAAGQSFDWAVTEQVIVDADLNWAGFTMENGAYVSLPVWSLTAQSGAKYQVLAVADESLKF